MKKIQNPGQKLQLSRETLRRLQASQLEKVVGGTTVDFSCPFTTCDPCKPSLNGLGCV